MSVTQIKINFDVYIDLEAVPVRALEATTFACVKVDIFFIIHDFSKVDAILAKTLIIAIVGIMVVILEVEGTTGR